MNQDRLLIIELFYRIQMDLENHPDLRHLSEVSSTSPSTLYNWLEGKTKAPRISTLNRVGSALGYKIMLVRD